MALTLHEAVARMTPAAARTPELVGQVAATVTRIHGDLGTFQAAAKSIKDRVAEMESRVRTEQQSLRARVQEHGTSLEARLQGLSSQLTALSRLATDAEARSATELAGARAAASEAAGTLDALGSVLDSLGAEHRTVVEPSVGTMREAGNRLQASLEKVSQELLGFHGDLVNMQGDGRAQVEALQEAVRKGQAQVRAGWDHLAGAGDKKIAGLDPSLQEKLAEGPAPRLDRLVAALPEALERDLQKPAAAAVADLESALRGVAAMLRELEAPCVKTSTELDRHSKTYQQGPQLRMLLQASKQVLARVGKLGLLANLV